MLRGAQTRSPRTSPWTEAHALAVAKDGKVLIAGHSSCDYVVGRFTAAPDNESGPTLRLDA